MTKNKADKFNLEAVLHEQLLLGRERELKALILARGCNFPALLVGETGTGKTYMLRRLAREYGAEVVRVSCHGESGAPDLIGKYLARDGSTYWEDGRITYAMRAGAWLILDEINAATPEVLFCLNALLDDERAIVLAEKDGERVTPAPGFRVFATMNPCEEYAGTKELNKALLSRFPIVLDFEPYTPEQEQKIVEYQSGVNDTMGRVIVDVGNIIRELKHKAEVFYTCSTRDLVSWGRLMTCDTMTIEEAFTCAVLNKATAEEREKILKGIRADLPLRLPWKKSGDYFHDKLTKTLAYDVEQLETKRKAILKQVKALEAEVESEPTKEEATTS